MGQSERLGRAFSATYRECALPELQPFKLKFFSSAYLYQESNQLELVQFYSNVLAFQFLVYESIWYL